MPELSLHDIDFISRDMQMQDICFSHLADDLIDHICCDVEEQMLKGLSFADAYNAIRKQMGQGRVKEIQEETLYSVDTKYRNMKKTMKITGIAGSVILGFAAVFKILHLPGAGIMLTLGAFILAFVFMPSALVVLWKESHNGKKLSLFISAFLAGVLYILGFLFKIQHWPIAGILIIVSEIFALVFIGFLLDNKLRYGENKAKYPVYCAGALGFAAFIIGFLFKVQYWPYASILIVSGQIILFVVAFPWYTYLTWKEDNHISSKFLFMMLASALFVLPATLINLKLQISYEEGFFINHGQQQAMFLYENENNKVLLNQYSDSASNRYTGQIHLKTVELINLISNIETKMVKEAEGEPGIPAIYPSQVITEGGNVIIQSRMLTKPFHNVPVNDFLLPGCSSRKELEAALGAYSQYISSIASTSIKDNLITLLDVTNYLPSGNPPEYNMPLISGLHSLSLLKCNILLVEGEVIYLLRGNN